MKEREVRLSFSRGEILKGRMISELWIMNLVFIYFLSLLFLFSIFFFYFFFSFNFLFFILNLDKKCHIMLYMIVKQVISHDKKV